MKKTQIIAIIIIAISVGVILSTIIDSSTYADFAVARENPEKEFQVVGTLNLEKDINYDPESSPYFTFYLVDKENAEQYVKFKGAKPQDFERADEVVITGKYEGDEFYASKILMKCPSKYNNGQDIEIKAVGES